MMGVIQQPELRLGLKQGQRQKQGYGRTVIVFEITWTFDFV